MTSPKPYWAGELIGVAVNRNPTLDPMRVLATYADRNNWTTVHDNGRCYWAWVGPVIVGYEFAEWVTSGKVGVKSSEGSDDHA